MATLVNIATSKSGIPIPAGLVIADAVHFPFVQFSKDKDDNLVKKKFLTADLTHFATLQVLKDSLGKESLGTVDNIPTSYVRELSEADETALAGANALGVVKTWIKDYIEETVGAGNCSIITL